VRPSCSRAWQGHQAKGSSTHRYHRARGSAHRWSSTSCTCPRGARRRCQARSSSVLSRSVVTRRVMNEAQSCSIVPTLIEARLLATNDDGEFELRTNRNVLRCSNSACRASFWNRDVNAARNILELLATRLIGLGRIAAFARGWSGLHATWVGRISIRNHTTRSFRSFEESEIISARRLSSRWRNVLPKLGLTALKLNPMVGEALCSGFVPTACVGVVHPSPTSIRAREILGRKSLPCPRA